MKLFLSKSIYHIDSIQKAINTYHGLADIVLIEKGNYWVCSFSNTQYNDEETAKEFENYIIAMEV